MEKSYGNKSMLQGFLVEQYFDTTRAPILILGGKQGSGKTGAVETAGKILEESF